MTLVGCCMVLVIRSAVASVIRDDTDDYAAATKRGIPAQPTSSAPLHAAVHNQKCDFV
jgi:hypothetical protein